MPTYELLSHAECLTRRPHIDLAQALDDLSHAAFGSYDGVIAGTPEFKRWFMSRPGMTDESRFLALCDGEPVSSLFITVTPMRFGREIMTAGLVDSVMTHPGHRRRGLARGLLSRAIESMRERGLDLSLLYTVAGSMPYDFYASLGYVDYLRVQVLEKPDRGAPGVSVPRRAPEPALVRGMLDAAFAGHDGYLPMSDALWQWRRERRPSSVPVRVHALGDEEAPRAIFAIGRAPIRQAGGRASKSMLNDCAVFEGGFDAATCQQMAAFAPAGGPIVAACADTNAADRAAFDGAGFRPVGEEAGMILPLSPRAGAALEHRPKLWYTVTETIVGI